MATGTPDYSPKYISSGESTEQLQISASDTDASGTFSQQVRSILLYNDGPSPVHFNEDSAATTSNFKVPSKSWLTIDVPITVVHVICASGETATVYVIGVY